MSHKQKRHRCPKTFTCKECNEEFPKKYQLDGHIAEHHVVDDDGQPLPPLPEALQIEEDPEQPTQEMVPDSLGDDEFSRLYLNKWGEIRTKVKHFKVQSLYRIRLTSADPQHLFKILAGIFCEVSHS